MGTNVKTVHFILDTSFVRNLERFDRFFKEETTYYNQEKPEQTPFGGLAYLTKTNATLVLPNEVLRQLTLNNRGDSVGLGRKEDGTPYLDFRTLSDFIPIQSTLFQLLHKKYSDGDLACFASVKDYQKAAQHGELAHKLAIVADLPLQQGTGVFTARDFKNRRDKSPKLLGNDHEILKLGSALSPPVTATGEIWENACFLLTSNALLASDFRRVGEPYAIWQTYFLTPFFDLLNVHGFMDNPEALTLATASFKIVYDKEIPFGAHLRHPEDPVIPLNTIHPPQITTRPEPPKQAPVRFTRNLRFLGGNQGNQGAGK